MEISCNRCHQTVQADNCYCPSCGMPQLLYAADAPAGQAQPAHWDEAAPDAATVRWKPALRAAIVVAIPTGVFSSGILQVGGLSGIIVMAAAAAWAVTLYVRSQRPAWITAGAGARIGVVMGMMASWLGFGLNGCDLYVHRFFLHQAGQMDAAWKSFADADFQSSQQMIQQWATWMGGANAAQVQANQAGMHAWMLSPWGHAGFEVFNLAAGAVFLLLFAAGGGALGARMLAGTRRTQA